MTVSNYAQFIQLAQTFNKILCMWSDFRIKLRSINHVSLNFLKVPVIKKHCNVLLTAESSSGFGGLSIKNFNLTVGRNKQITTIIPYLWEDCEGDEKPKRDPRKNFCWGDNKRDCGRVKIHLNPSSDFLQT